MRRRPRRGRAYQPRAHGSYCTLVRTRERSKSGFESKNPESTVERALEDVDGHRWNISIDPFNPAPTPNLSSIASKNDKRGPGGSSRRASGLGDWLDAELTTAATVSA